VLTVPFELRARLAYDDPWKSPTGDKKLLGSVCRIHADSVLGFYRRRMRDRGVADGRSGAVSVVQRTSGSAVRSVSHTPRPSVPRSSASRFTPPPPLALTVPKDARPSCATSFAQAIAQERVQLLANDLVRIHLRRPFRDGTFAVDLDPLSLLCRLAASVPPPYFNVVRYAGVLAPRSKLRPLVERHTADAPLWLSPLARALDAHLRHRRREV
jgi:hypothetical protein